MESREVHLPPYRFFETRAGHGTPVVLLHGLGGSTEWWRHNFELIAESHTVAAVDLVGFGRNRRFFGRTPLPPVIAELAALLTRWIESSFTEPVHLVGHSMGGHVAIHAAAARPDLIRSLTLVDATGIPFRLDARAHLEELMVPAGLGSFSLVLLRDLFRAGPTSFALGFVRLLLDDARPLMRQLKMPVLLIWGDRDPLVPPHYAEEMAREIEGSRVVVIPAASHNPMWERPDIFNGALLHFIAEVDAASRPAGERGAFSWGLAGWNDGIMHRQAGRHRNVILVHGLGMSSRYFEPFARALFEKGLDPVAPDMRGFGNSVNSPALSHEEHAEDLIHWADALEIRSATWIGHSTGCGVVAAIARLRPDLVSRGVYIGPLWSRTRHPNVRFALALALDATRETLALWRHVLPAYWRVGAWRWLMTWLRQVGHIRDAAPEGLMIAGERDPLVDRNVIAPVEVPGAHACQVSFPDLCASVVENPTTLAP